MAVQARFAAVVIGRGDEMARAVAAAGGQVVATLDWGQAGAVDRIGGTPVLALEAIGADAEGLAEGLPAVAATAAARALPVVVALDGTQFDLVAAELLGEGIHLLHLPSPAERVAHLVIAAREGDPEAFGGVREDGPERLDRLNTELARLVDLLSTLTRQEPRRTVADRTSGFGAAPLDMATAAVEAGDVRRVIRARRLRDKAFEAGLFEDPAWDILLDLFAAALEASEVSVSSLCIAAAVAPTTALRWIGRLTAAGLLVRQRDTADRRRALMSLSAPALAAMRSYAAMLRAQGLPFV